MPAPMTTALPILRQLHTPRPSPRSQKASHSALTEAPIAMMTDRAKSTGWYSMIPGRRMAAMPV
ncbi:hypothetical protein D3C72_822070 [compost metagenome]